MKHNFLSLINLAEKTCLCHEAFVSEVLDLLLFRFWLSHNDVEILTSKVNFRIWIIPNVCPSKFCCLIPFDFAVVSLGQKVHTESKLGGTRMTSIEIENTGSEYEVTLDLYKKTPLASVASYKQITIYTFPYLFEVEEEEDEDFIDGEVLVSTFTCHIRCCD